MITPPKLGIVSIELTVEEAERLRDGMADLLCWCDGFKAGLGDDRLDRFPMGVETTRDMNIKLKSAIGKAF